MKLIHEGKCLCDIRDVCGDYPWMSGHVDFAALEPEYQELFEFLTDENREHEAPPFLPRMIESDNWQIDNNGLVRGIELPAVYSDGAIMWRWR